MKKMKLSDAFNRINDLKVDKNTNFIEFNVSELAIINQTNIDFMKRLKSRSNSELNDQIDLRETYFTSNDDILKGLKSMKLKKLKDLKESVLAILNSSIKEREETLKANLLPDEIVLKYKELIRNAKRDETTLARLESDKRLLNLEFSRDSVPWKIITEPTILDYPAAPNKKVYAFGGLIIGFLFGTFIAFLIEKRKNNIFNKNDLAELFGINENSIITYTDNSESNEDIELFLENFIINEKNEKISILNICEVDKVKFNNLKSFISKEIKYSNIVITDNFKETIVDNKQIILCEIGLSNLEDLKNLRTKFDLINKKPDGIIMIKNI